MAQREERMDRGLRTVRENYQNHGMDNRTDWAMSIVQQTLKGWDYAIL